MLEAFAPAHRVRTLVLLAVAAVLAGVGWFGAGVDDNPVGILLVLLGGTSLASAFLHPIRESGGYRRAFTLTLIALAGSVAIALAMESLGAALRPPGSTEEGVLGAVGIYIFVVVSFIGVPALVVSTVGYRIALNRERRRSTE